MTLKTDNSSNIKLLLLSLLTSLDLLASSGLYLEAGAGLGYESEIETKNNNYIYEKNYIAIAAIGYQYDAFRFELEGRYKKDSLYSSNYTQDNISVNGDLTHESKMVNIYYSGYNSSKLVSSIGFGVGVTDIKLKNLIELNTAQIDIIDTNILSYQGMFSVGYMLSHHFTITTKYTYFQTSDSDSFDSSGDSTLSLSLRYLF